MADLTQPTRKAIAVLLVATVGAVEVQSIAQTVTSQGRLRDRVVASARALLLQSFPQLRPSLQAVDPMTRRSGLQTALTMNSAAEADLLDPSGRVVLAIPERSSVVAVFPKSDLAGLREGEIFIMGPLIGPPSRLLSFVAFPSPAGRLILRLSTPIPDLIADLRDRELSLVGHGVALLSLVLAAGLLLAPSRTAAPQGTTSALDAYAEAMGRLGEQGRALSAEHSAERERLESAFRERDAMARAGELTGGIVHEVRNGLGTILGYARLLERATDSPAALEEIRSIREECETLEGVIRRFTDFIKTESLQVAPFDLRRMLSRVVARECKSRPGARVQLADRDAGATSADEELLERAFENLVRNARDAAGDEGSVSIDVERTPAGTTTTISDDGPGFGVSERERLRPFFTTKARGLGLGLPTARKIIELHQGHIVFLDRVPHGLTVRVFLPLAPVSPDPAVVSTGE